MLCLFLLYRKTHQHMLNMHPFFSDPPPHAGLYRPLRRVDTH